MAFSNKTEYDKLNEMSRKVEIVNMIKTNQNMKGIFNNLLFTHNTLIPTFMMMLSGEYSFIRCCDFSTGRKRPVGLGAQFRYGLDSQYGEIKLIMKPEFWKRYNQGVIIDYSNKDNPKAEGIVNTPVFYDYWLAQGYQDTDPDLLYLLKTEALNYNFRIIDETLGLVNEGAPDCKKYSNQIIENKNKGIPPSVLSSVHPSWCNVQLHLGDNVNFDDIMAIIVPGFLKNPNIMFRNRPIVQILDEAQNNDTLQNGRPNPFKGKLVFSNTSYIPSKYYNDYDNMLGVESKSGNVEELNFYNNLNKIMNNQEKSSYNPFMQRKSKFGSSLVSVNAEDFVIEQKLYFLLLVSVGYYQ